MLILTFVKKKSTNYLMESLGSWHGYLRDRKNSSCHRKNTIDIRRSIKEHKEKKINKNKRALEIALPNPFLTLTSKSLASNVNPAFTSLEATSLFICSFDACEGGNTKQLTDEIIPDMHYLPEP